MLNNSQRLKSHTQKTHLEKTSLGYEYFCYAQNQAGPGSRQKLPAFPGVQLVWRGALSPVISHAHQGRKQSNERFSWNLFVVVTQVSVELCTSCEIDPLSCARQTDKG